MKKIIILMTILTLGIISSSFSVYAAPATVTVKQYYTLSGFPVVVEELNKYCCKCPHSAGCCTCKCVDISTTIMLSFDGGGYSGNIQFAAGMIEEHHTGLPTPSGETDYYPNPANYTFYSSTFIEITECDDYPEVIGTIIDISNMTTDGGGNLIFSFTL
jgi:hypothetical protein